MTDDWRRGVIDAARALAPLVIRKGTSVAQEFKRPVELAGLKARLHRARALESKIGNVGKNYDKVLDAIEEKIGQSESHLGQLEKYDAELADTIRQMIGEGSNSPPDESGSRG